MRVRFLRVVCFGGGRLGKWIFLLISFYPWLLLVIWGGD